MLYLGGSIVTIIILITLRVLLFDMGFIPILASVSNSFTKTITRNKKQRLEHSARFARVDFG